ncbi:hypothetical protein [Sinorhizobium meliloti]|uniref:hypothetical protein n=2 Tax=Rhizobium meliloti TaxID=382 RepID=UPI000FD91340|nr:hypothetical protein [Sinorhizobium meliloti]RVG45963.1 hypothetical protein CN226_29075 [Sinorhizobium meliloti]
MRTPRIDGNAILADAKLRRAALACADLSASGLWPPNFEAGFCGRMSRRIEKRLFASLAERDGDPVTLETAARLLVAMTDDERHQAAVAAGLIYHLSALGTVIDRHALSALTALFGKPSLSIALSCAHVSPRAAQSLGVSDEEWKQVVEADGWAILDLWAAEHGLTQTWRGWSRQAVGGSVFLVASAALAIASAVVRHGEFTQGEAK